MPNGNAPIACANRACPLNPSLPLRPLLHPAERLRAYRVRKNAELATLRHAVKTRVEHRHQWDEWPTPPELFDPLDAEFHFTLDACAWPHNTKCARFWTPDDDGLTQPWTDVVWCNPPYGRGVVELWIAKAHASAQAGATVVCLVKPATSTKWWHTYTPAAEVRFLPKRVKFVGATHSAPFSSCLVIFRPPGNALRQEPRDAASVCAPGQEGW